MLTIPQVVLRLSNLFLLINPFVSFVSGEVLHLPADAADGGGGRCRLVRRLLRDEGVVLGLGGRGRRGHAAVGVGRDAARPRGAPERHVCCRKTPARLAARLAAARLRRRTPPAQNYCTDPPALHRAEPSVHSRILCAHRRARDLLGSSVAVLFSLAVL